MGWFDRFAVQTSYQAGRRLTGILRYRELTDRYFGAFFKANLLTIFGFLPMGIGFLFVPGLETRRWSWRFLSSAAGSRRRF